MPATLAHHTHHHFNMVWGMFVILIAAILVILIMAALTPNITLPGTSIIPVTGNQSANEMFRQEELALYNRTTSSIGSESFYAFRMGEWATKPIDARYEFRHGEWFGN